MTDKLETLLAQCRALLSAGDDSEAVLSLLRQNQCSQLDSIKALMRSTGLGLADAKQTVHLSETWAAGAPARTKILSCPFGTS